MNQSEVSPYQHISQPQRFMQKVSFQGMSIGNLRPTDIDCSFDYGRWFVLVEAKCKYASVPVGQEINLRKMSWAFKDARRSALIIIAEHDTNHDEHVLLHSCNVRLFINTTQSNGVWQKPEEPITVRELINQTLKVEMK